MKRLLFIYNPHAGKGLIKPKLSDVIDIFVKSGYTVTIHPTQSYRDAYNTILTYEADHFDLIICSGGDGTIDEVVSGMMKRGPRERTTIGYIPTGTTNDFATGMHLSKNLLSAADTAVNGSPFPFDVGRFNDDSFVYIAAFGLFTDVSYQTNQGLKNILGHLAYILEGTKRIFNVPSYKVRVCYDDTMIEEEFIYGMVTNSKSVGGFKHIIGRNVAFDDGVFEVTLIKTPKNPIELQEIVAALLIEQIDTKHMYNFRAGNIHFESDEEIPWTLDGEFGGTHYNVEIENMTRQLSLMVPNGNIQALLNDKERIAVQNNLALPEGKEQ